MSSKSSITVDQLYPTESALKTSEEIALEERRAKVDAAFACLSQYANPKLRKKEILTFDKN